MFKYVADLDLVDSLSAQLKLLTYSTIAWFVVFWIVSDNVRPKGLKKRQVDDVKNRIVSIMHGLWAFVLSLAHILNDCPEYGSRNTSMQHFIMITSSAYFIYDYIACVWYKLIDTSVVVHHTMVIIGYTSAII